MTKDTPTVPPEDRTEALAAIWTILDAPRFVPSETSVEADAVPVGRVIAAKQTQHDNFPRHDVNSPVMITNSLAYNIIKRGISSRALDPLGKALGLGKGVVAEYLDLDRGTANRRASRDLPLPTHAAESVMRILEIDQMAAETFESEAESSNWLRKPHPMLDGETPLECAKSSYGTQRVKDILLAIKYGGVV
jgi:putative toxin-antitoxin system antitoxin component (TIGR02293 family)